MIKVLKEETVPKATITCSNCGSLLEYGNADLFRDYSNEANQMLTNYSMRVRNYLLRCPVCGVEQPASWVNK